MSKLLVLFVFHQYNGRVKNYIDNCLFFDENVDFIIISNNKNNDFEAPHYVKKIFRDNIGYDFGGWSDALLTDNLYEKYDNFIFVNSSAVGPYLKSDFEGKWTDIYVNGLQGNVKLFGSVINAGGDPKKNAHVQSYIFSMNKTTLEYLIDCEIFSMTNYAENFGDAIFKKEVLMSRKIIANDWNIGSLTSYYKDVDFTFKTKDISEFKKEWLHDLMIPRFKNSIWNKFEIVFVKGNRGVLP